MAKKKGKGRGWHGDSAGHAAAASKGGGKGKKLSSNTKKDLARLKKGKAEVKAYKKRQEAAGKKIRSYYGVKGFGKVISTP